MTIDDQTNSEQYANWQAGEKKDDEPIAMPIVVETRQDVHDRLAEIDEIYIKYLGTDYVTLLGEETINTKRQEFMNVRITDAERKQIRETFKAIKLFFFRVRREEAIFADHKHKPPFEASLKDEMLSFSKRLVTARYLRQVVAHGAVRIYHPSIDMNGSSVYRTVPTIWYTGNEKHTQATLHNFDRQERFEGMPIFNYDHQGIQLMYPIMQMVFSNPTKSLENYKSDLDRRGIEWQNSAAEIFLTMVVDIVQKSVHPENTKVDGIDDLDVKRFNKVYFDQLFAEIQTTFRERVLQNPDFDAQTKADFYAGLLSVFDYFADKLSTGAGEVLSATIRSEQRNNLHRLEGADTFVDLTSHIYKSLVALTATERRFAEQLDEESVNNILEQVNAIIELTEYFGVDYSDAPSRKSVKEMFLGWINRDKSDKRDQIGKYDQYKQLVAENATKDAQYWIANYKEFKTYINQLSELLLFFANDIFKKAAITKRQQQISSDNKEDILTDTNFSIISRISVLRTMAIEFINPDVAAQFAREINRNDLAAQSLTVAAATFKHAYFFKGLTARLWPDLVDAIEGQPMNNGRRFIAEEDGRAGFNNFLRLSAEEPVFNPDGTVKVDADGNVEYQTVELISHPMIRRILKMIGANEKRKAVHSVPIEDGEI